MQSGPTLFNRRLATALLLLLSGAACFLGINSSSGSKNILLATKGHVDFEEKSPDFVHRIAGEWLFFPNESLNIPQIEQYLAVSSNPIATARIGQSLQNLGVKVGSDGSMIGTFAVFIDNFGPGTWLIGIPQAFYTNTIDLKCLAGKSSIPIYPELGTIQNPYSRKNRFQVSNQSTFSCLMVIGVRSGLHHWSGIWQGADVGEPRKYITKSASEDWMQIVVSSVLSFLALHHFIIWRKLKDDIASLIFSLLCISVMMRSLLFFSIYQDLIPYEVYAYLVSPMCILPTLVGLFFMQSAFKIPEVEKFYLYYAGLGFLAIVAFFILPLSITTSFFDEIYVYIGVTSCLGFSHLVVAYIRGFKGSGISLFGGFVFLISVIYEVVSTTKGHSTPYYIASLGVIFFAVSQSFYLSLRIASIFKNQEILSQRLLDEQEARQVMAAKASHHLNNPFMVISASAVNIVKQTDNLQKKFQTLLPAEHNRDVKVRAVVKAFQILFKGIVQDAEEVGKALKRAQQAANALRQLSGVHGKNIQFVSYSSLWNEVIQRSKDFFQENGLKVIVMEAEGEWMESQVLVGTDLFVYALTDLLTSLVHEAENHVIVSLEQSEGGCFIRLNTKDGLQRALTHDARFLQIVAAAYSCEIRLSLEGIRLEFKRP